MKSATAASHRTVKSSMDHWPVWTGAPSDAIKLIVVAEFGDVVPRLRLTEGRCACYPPCTTPSAAIVTRLRPGVRTVCVLPGEVGVLTASQPARRQDQHTEDRARG